MSVYTLSEHMGTSVKMIEDHYGQLLLRDKAHEIAGDKEWIIEKAKREAKAKQKDEVRSQAWSLAAEIKPTSPWTLQLLQELVQQLKTLLRGSEGALSSLCIVVVVSVQRHLKVTFFWTFLTSHETPYPLLDSTCGYLA